MKIAVLSAVLLLGCCVPAQAQRGGGFHGGFGGGFGRAGDFGRGFDRWGYGFDRWGYGLGPFGFWGLYGYPYAAYASFYYPPSMYYVPPTYATVAQPVVSYYPVPVPVTVTPPTIPYSGYVGAPVTPAPSDQFSTNAAPRPSYPGFTPRPSTGSSGYYPDAP